MGTTRLTGSVGRRGKNHKEDIQKVQNLLNEYILAGQLGAISFLDDNRAGEGSETEIAIREFQSRVMHVPPTGLVANGSDELLSLCKSPKENGVVNLVRGHVNKWALAGPPRGGAIPPDLWQAALQSLATHATHPRLVRYSMMTLVDFRLSRRVPRLWVVDLHDSIVRIHTHVAHGKGREAKMAKDVPDNFGEPYSSRLGAYIATWRDHVRAGQSKADKKNGVTGPGVRVQGLDESNRMAANIGILFHGACYVNPPQGIFENSRGCFATSFVDNSRIVDFIKDGSFVYAYAGNEKRPAS